MLCHDIVIFEYPILTPKNPIAIRDEQFFLWNPSTRRFSGVDDKIGRRKYVFGFGFGFDELSDDDYKILRMLSWLIDDDHAGYI